jgi:hypothetical protein
VGDRLLGRLTNDSRRIHITESHLLFCPLVSRCFLVGTAVPNTLLLQPLTPKSLEKTTRIEQETTLKSINPVLRIFDADRAQISECVRKGAFRRLDLGRYFVIQTTSKATCPFQLSYNRLFPNSTALSNVVVACLAPLLPLLLPPPYIRLKRRGNK